MERQRIEKSDLLRIKEMCVKYLEETPARNAKEASYPEILQAMADSMLSDDAILVTDGYFDRVHG